MPDGASGKTRVTTFEISSGGISLEVELVSACDSELAICGNHFVASTSVFIFSQAQKLLEARADGCF